MQAVNTTSGEIVHVAEEARCNTLRGNLRCQFINISLHLARILAFESHKRGKKPPAFI